MSPGVTQDDLERIRQFVRRSRRHRRPEMLRPDEGDDTPRDPDDDPTGSPESRD